MAANQAPLSLGFTRQEHWSGLPFPSPMHACMLSCFSYVQLCVTPWTAAHQVPLSTGFSRQEYWSGLPFPSPPLYIWTTSLSIPLSMFFFKWQCSQTHLFRILFWPVFSPYATTIFYRYKVLGIPF